uniref:Uncharacterized protein n=1 Tax=Anopheles epiroticus TaxID=199890 RepID=A0A240PN92_9DIPT
MPPTSQRSCGARCLVALGLLTWAVSSTVGGSLMYELTLEAGDLVKGCLRRPGSTLSRWDCVKNESLVAVRQLSNAPRIVLLDGMQLVRADDAREKYAPDAVGEQEGAVAGTWSNAVLNALRRLLDTHVLEIDLAYPEDASAQHLARTALLAIRVGDPKQYPHPGRRSFAEGEGRHRRRQQMIPMMIFGVTVFGMFIVPIAFQFLTALSGKAFLMAKLALLLASINGLKRVASAGVHYGLYHAVDHYPVPAQHPPPPFHQHPHAAAAGPLLYDRAEWPYAEGPRGSSASALAPFFWAALPRS